jgi:hypothetical protein
MRKSVTQQNCAHATDQEMAELLEEAKSPRPRANWKAACEHIAETSEIYEL